MRSFRWLCLVGVLAAACTARGGGGNFDPDASADDTPATPEDGPVGSDTPGQDPDATPGVDVPFADVPVTPDAPPPIDVPGARCGDGTCNSGETCGSCPQDCRECPPPMDVPSPDVPAKRFCGDGTCNGSETCGSCAQDCDCPPPPDVPTSCAGSSCGDCVMAAGCGWCTIPGVPTGICTPGTASGPTAAPCPGTWVGPGRGTSCTTTPPPTSPTTACAGGTFSGYDRECSWGSVRTFTCTPGRPITVGCNSTVGTGSACTPTLGTCTGDAVIRVCSGATACASGSAQQLAAEDDTCGLCPVSVTTCPSSGQVTVLAGPYASDRAGSCTPALR